MGRRAAYGFILLAIIGGSLLLRQCSPQTGRRMLTLFFDGVPEHDSANIDVPTDSSELLQPRSSDQTELLSAGETILVHYPYGERECNLCHDPGSLGEMLEPQPGLCYTCHDDYGNSYSSLHGPVAGGYCTSCHDPHSSRQEKLLRITGSSLCYHCHQEGDVLENEMHNDLEGMECTDCHNPHGGADRFILY